MCLDLNFQIVSHFFKYQLILSFIQANSEETCECGYECKWGHAGAIGCNGGCKITTSPPKGWHCECVYRGAWTCAGYARLCYELDQICIGNSGCKERRCCSGDCQGY